MCGVLPARAPRVAEIICSMGHRMRCFNIVWRAAMPNIKKRLQLALFRCCRIPLSFTTCHTNRTELVLHHQTLPQDLSPISIADILKAVKEDKTPQDHCFEKYPRIYLPVFTRTDDWRWRTPLTTPHKNVPYQLPNRPIMLTRFGGKGFIYFYALVACRRAF